MAYNIECDRGLVKNRVLTCVTVGRRRERRAEYENDDWGNGMCRKVRREADGATCTRNMRRVVAGISFMKGALEVVSHKK